MITPELILGGVSCVFWTITLQTTLKYVIITLKADNKGEGGIFSLYALVRRTKSKWLVWPAMIGGAALLADGMITPPISVASAIEGLHERYEGFTTLPYIIGIITAIFILQQFGTKFIGKFFGPVMLVWFCMIGVLGFMELVQVPEILKAVNPYYAYNLLVNTPGGFWLLGAVFLCTTGAEALYSDLGHCGRTNIRITWTFVKTTLLLSYFGQGAWLLGRAGTSLGNDNPFYSLVPHWFLIPSIIIATSAAIVASQAMISASFTLINEAIRLNFWPKVRIVYPTTIRGQLYVPAINWILWAGCMGITLYFQKSSGMEAAYGLAIIITMMSTTTLLSYYLYLRRRPLAIIIFTALFFLAIEGSFMIANLAKLVHGGWLTLLVALMIISLMNSWYQARKIRNRFVDFVKMKDYLNLLIGLSHDYSIPKYATHLVYLTSANNADEVEQSAMYSILQKQPKRADMYWFVHVDVLDEPYTMEYRVTELVKGNIMRIDFRLGFRMEPRINLMFRKVVEDLVRNLEVDITSRYDSLSRKNLIGDFRFVVMEKYLSYDYDLPFYEKIFLDVYFFFKGISLSEERAFGLDTSSVTVEKVPLMMTAVKEINLKRVK